MSAEVRQSYSPSFPLALKPSAGILCTLFPLQCLIHPSIISASMFLFSLLPWLFDTSLVCHLFHSALLPLIWSSCVVPWNGSSGAVGTKIEHVVNTCLVCWIMDLLFDQPPLCLNQRRGFRTRNRAAVPSAFPSAVNAKSFDSGSRQRYIFFGVLGLHQINKTACA